MASIQPTTTTIPFGFHVPLSNTNDEENVEDFQLPDLIKFAGPLRQFIEQRLTWGGGRKDEVWEGVYYMSPDPTNFHQRFILRLCIAIDGALSELKAVVQPGGNISDRAQEWYKNYRCPDVIVVLPGNQIQDHNTFWLGGPDFVVEVLSEGDDSIEKLPFYAKVGTREVLHIDPETNELTLFALRDGTMQVVGKSSTVDNNIVASTVLPVSFQVQGDPAKPLLAVQHTAKPELRWLI